MGQHFSPAAVLKAIRDGKATEWDELNRRFGGEEQWGEYYTLRRVVGDLESAGLIVFKDGRFVVTEQWIRIQGTLGISLTALDQSARPGVLSVVPLFGTPGTPKAASDVFVLMSFDPKYKPIYTTHISRVVKNLGLTAARG